MRSLLSTSSSLFSACASGSVCRLQRRHLVTVEVKRDAVHVPSLRASFPNVWLRDSCQCSICVHPSTRQKLHRSSDFSEGVTPASVEAVDGALRIVWNSQHASSYPLDFLEQYSSPSSLSAFHKDIDAKPWKADLFASKSTDNLLVPYAKLSDPKTLLSVYRQLLQYGLVFLKDVPTQETSDERCELRVVAEKLGEIRKTFYGETWDVRNIRNSKNIAYTNLDLGLHMDLLYFNEPPRYQILHCLRNRVRGGQSVFVDALQAARELQVASPSEYALLVKTPVPFHYINDGHHLHHSHPTLEFKNGVLTSVNYSPPFQAPLPASTPLAFFKALAAFSERLNDPANCFAYLLREGDAVIFDNRRVLHGRAAFEDEAGAVAEGDTNRWLKGCYLEEDPVLDRMRVLATEIE